MTRALEKRCKVIEFPMKIEPCASLYLVKNLAHFYWNGSLRASLTSKIGCILCFFPGCCDAGLVLTSKKRASDFFWSIRLMCSSHTVCYKHQELLLIFNFFRSFETPLGVIDYVLMFFVGNSAWKKMAASSMLHKCTKSSFFLSPQKMRFNSAWKIPFDWPSNDRKAVMMMLQLEETFLKNLFSKIWNIETRKEGWV